MSRQLTQEPVSRRNFLDRILIATGLAAAATIGGAAYVAIDQPRTRSQASEPDAPGPEITSKVERARPATLTPLLDGRPLSFEAREGTVEIGAGVRYRAWTFEGSLPGPVVHVRQGDTVNFTLRNGGRMGHSMDFHAAETPWDKNYKTILPGESISFAWRASYPGVFMYHCGTAPVLEHLQNGMYGAVVVDPQQPFAPAREYVLVQSEFYVRPGAAGEWEGDLNKAKGVRPDLLAFNGVAFQYRDVPLTASAGELVRLYVVNAGPTLFSAFHVVGAIFESAYVDGNPENRLRGIQTLTIPPGGGATFELRIPEPGLYPIVTHSFAYTERGALGLLRVT